MRPTLHPECEDCYKRLSKERVMAGERNCDECERKFLQLMRERQRQEHLKPGPRR